MELDEPPSAEALKFKKDGQLRRNARFRVSQIDSQKTPEEIAWEKLAAECQNE
jgi:hypothetical protein